MVELFIILGILVLTLIVLINILIIRMICNYQAKKNAEYFDYDYLADRTAAEVYKRLIFIESQKTAAKNATGTAEDQNLDTRTGGPELNDSRQA